MSDVRSMNANEVEEGNPLVKSGEGIHGSSGRVGSVVRMLGGGGGRVAFGEVACDVVSVKGCDLPPSWSGFQG